MEQFLIDSNSVSDYLSLLLPEKGMQVLDEVINKIPNLSIITQIELLSWNTNDKGKEHKVQDFVSDSAILGISADVVIKCVAIRKGKKIKTPDAIIAATALANKFTLVTSNEKDSKGIFGLKIINPKLL